MHASEKLVYEILQKQGILTHNIVRYDFLCKIHNEIYGIEVKKTGIGENGRWHIGINEKAHSSQMKLSEDFGWKRLLVIVINNKFLNGIYAIENLEWIDSKVKPSKNKKMKTFSVYEPLRKYGVLFEEWLKGTSEKGIFIQNNRMVNGDDCFTRVFNLRKSGMSIKEISSKLNIKYPTVTSYLYRHPNRSEVIVPRKRWRPSEVKILKDCYLVLNRKALHEKLPERTWHSIVRNANRLGLAYSHYERWTPSEIELLENYKTYSKERLMGDLPQRTWPAITTKANKMGFNKTK